MELRVLEYFLTVAREQNISKAAEALHLTQPTLSRQLKELEEELGKQLFIRGSRKITLTDEGMLLRKRAEEISTLVRKTEQEVSQSDEQIAGDIYIGAGETDNIRILARVSRRIRENNPLVRIHIVSGDKKSITEELDKGLLDFGLLFGSVDSAKYDFFDLPSNDVWGLLMRKDHPLAAKDFVTYEEVRSVPLIISRQMYQGGEISSFLKCSEEEVDVAATYNLLFNGSLMVEEGVGCALSIDKVVNVTGNSRLCFRPIAPTHEAEMLIAWKKYSVFSKAAELYLHELQNVIEQQTANRE